jgi:hypothetical protein
MGGSSYLGILLIVRSSVLLVCSSTSIEWYLEWLLLFPFATCIGTGGNSRDAGCLVVRTLLKWELCCLSIS